MEMTTHKKSININLKFMIVPNDYHRFILHTIITIIRYLGGYNCNGQGG